MERLTTKELAPYLSYDLTVMGNINGIDTECCLTTWNIESHIQGQSKPLLRPLSSLTEEIEHNGERIRFSDVYLSKTQLEKLQNPSLCAWSSILNEFDYNFIQRLLRYHFDVFGLIDRGLALPIDGKEVEGE